MNFIQSQSPDQWLASKFKGTDVVGPDNQKVGDVSDLVFDKNGQIQAYVVSIGGFLGIGAKDVALAPKAFQTMPDNNASNPNGVKLQIAMTQDQLKNAPDFKVHSPPPTPSTSSLNPGGSHPSGTTSPMAPSGSR